MALQGWDVSSSPDLHQLPGHQLRRLQQIAVASFLMETQDWGVTPLQFDALTVLARESLLDQRSLSDAIGVDRSTLVGVLDRLADRGLIVRRRHPFDRRVHQLHLTREGHELLHQMGPGVGRAQARILAPLSPGERTQFVQMLRALVNRELA